MRINTRNCQVGFGPRNKAFMVDSGTNSYPRLGSTIAGRYLDAISCGGTDISALSMASSGPRWTPERPPKKSSHRKVLNDSSCGMTAPTAPLETSASWSSKETPSRSDAASRRSSARLNSRMVSAENGFATSPGKTIGMEDECSSIESSSSHRRSRPAHLSLNLDNSFGDASFDYESFGQSSSHCDPSPSRIMQKARAHLGERRYRKTALQRNSTPNILAGTTLGSIFPKTSPRTPPYGLKTNETRIATPHQVNQAGKRRAFSWKQPCLPEEAATDSVTGAPTEVITNRSTDLLKRSYLPSLNEPPQVRRWVSPAKADVTEAPMHCLIDDSSTNEESTSHGGDRHKMQALFDARSSSFSTSKSTDTSGREADIQNQQSSHQSATKYIFSSDLESLKNYDEPYPKTGAGAKGKAVFGGRTVGVASRTMRRWKTKAGRPQAQTATGTDLDNLGNELPVSPLRFFMKEDPIPQPRTPQPASSGEITSSVSTTDALLVPDVADRTPAATTFIRYNARKTPNAHEVFQRRYSDSSNTSTLSTSDKEHEEGSLPSRHPIQPLFSLDRLDFSYDTESPIRKRSQSKNNSGLATGQLPAKSKSFTANVQRDILLRADERPKKREAEQYKHFKNSEAAQRFAVKKTPSKSVSPDPIICPAGSISFSSGTVHSSEYGTISRSSHEDYINVRRSVATSWAAIDRNDSRSTGLDHDQVHTMMNNHENATREKVSNAHHAQNVGPSNGSTPSIGVSQNKETGGLTESLSSITPKVQNASVRERIQAYNLQPPDQWTPRGDTLRVKKPLATTSRESLVMGSRIARLVNEEKKEEKYFFYDDDDTGSVKSLRERFEKNQFGETKNHSPFHDPDDDENVSVKSLKEKLERYWSKEGIAFHDDDECDDEGSVRSLRERFEPPKKRESKDMVTNLRSVFEPKKAFPKLGSKSRTDVKKTAFPSSAKAQSVSKPDWATSPSRPHPSSNHDAAVSPSEIVTDSDSQAAHIGFAEQCKESTERSVGRKIDKYIELTKSEMSGKATEGSVDRDDDTISTHSSRVRGPAPTPFLSMRERLLKFSQEQPATTVNIQQKKPVAPSMHQRLNLWANRHQSRKQSEFASNNKIVSTVNKAENLQSPRGHTQAAPKSSPARSGFFRGTKEMVRGEKKSVDPAQHNKRLHDDNAETSAIFRKESTSKSSEQITTSGSESKFITRHDLMVKSSETDVSDGVTLDPSIADVSILTDPTIHRGEERKETNTQANASTLAAKKSDTSPGQTSETLVPLISRELSFTPTYQETNRETNVTPTHESRERGFEHMAANNLASPVALDNPSPSQPNDAVLHLEPLADTSLVHQTASSANPLHTSLGTGSFESVDWSHLDDGDWIDFSPSGTIENLDVTLSVGNELDSPKEKIALHMPHMSEDVSTKQMSVDRHHTIPPLVLSVPTETQMSSSHSRPPSNVSQHSFPTSSGTGDEESLFTTLDSEATSLPPLPSPFDKDYETLMDARHKMLMSRQRSHQERKAARERTRAARKEVPVEPPGLRMADYNPLVTPLLASERHHGNRGLTRNSFFSKTHPTLGGTKSLPKVHEDKIPAVERAPDKLSVKNSREAVRNYPILSIPPPSPAKNSGSAHTSNTQVQLMKGNVVSGQGTSADQPTSILTRLTGSIGRSGGATRHDTLVGRLKSVKAARIRRKVTNKRIPAHQTLEDEDSLDENVTNDTSSRQHPREPELPTPSKVVDELSTVNSSSEAFKRYMATSAPPPPPPLPPQRIPASYRVSSRQTAVATPLPGEVFSPSTIQANTNRFTPVATPLPPKEFSPFSNQANAKRFSPVVTPSLVPPRTERQDFVPHRRMLPPPPPPPRYPGAGRRYMPAPTPIAKHSFMMTSDDEFDNKSSSSSNSSSFFREGLTVD